MRTRVVNLESKLNRLTLIYKLYSEFVGEIETACRKYCADCCTSNVTLTTLEGYYILRALDSAQLQRLWETFEPHAAARKFKPRLTTNELARRCIEGKPIPDEDADVPGGSCPLLENALCPIYALRPFGCRCFISRHPCGEAGYAEVDDAVITVNTLFLQALEHLDAGGCTGNLTDVLRCLGDEKHRRDYRLARLQCRGAELIENRPLTVWMVPPEQRAQVAPLLESLRKLIS
jgi:Fe-S-cluster containining protein